MNMLNLPPFDPSETALKFATKAAAATNPHQQLADATTSLAWSAISAETKKDVPR